MLGISLSELCKWVSKKWRKVSRIVKRFGKYRRKVSWNVKWYGKYGRKISWRVKRYGKCGRKVGWIVKRFGKYRRKVSWIVKRFGKYRRKLWNDMENMDKMSNDRENMEETSIQSSSSSHIPQSSIHHHYSSSHQALRKSCGSDDHGTEFCVITCCKCCMKKNIRNNKTVSSDPTLKPLLFQWSLYKLIQQTQICRHIKMPPGRVAPIAPSRYATERDCIIPKPWGTYSQSVLTASCVDW